VPFEEIHARARRWLLCGACLWAVTGCGNGEIDRRDELGLEEENAEERYELVIVEASQTEETSGQEAPREDAFQTEALQTEDSPATEGGLKEQMASEAPSTPVYYDPKGDFTVQIGLYSDAKAARDMAKKLSAEGYPAYAVPNPDKKGIRVRIGYFKTRSDARRFGLIFKQDRDMDFWVDQRANEKF
jgi:cell division septation protein DedD